MRFTPLIAAALAVLAASSLACSKDEPKKTTATATDAGGSSYVIEPDFKLPQGIDPNAPMVPLVEPSPSQAQAAASADGDAAAAPAGSGKATKATAAAPAQPANVTATVKLVSNGAAPRQKLRYKFTAGQTETLTEELRTSAKIEAAGMDRQDQDSPPVKMVMGVNPTAVTPDGDCRYEYRIQSTDLAGDLTGVPPDALAEVRKQLSGLTGFGGWAIVSSRGTTKQTGDLSPPQGASDETMQLLGQFRQALKDLVPPLPEEEVGKGAVWTRTTLQPLGDGTAATQKETYTLSDMTGDQGKLDVAVEQSSPAQTLPPAPGGILRKIESSSATGHGTTLFDLGRIVPVSQNVDANSVTVQTLSQGGQSQKMKLTLRLGVKITGTKP